MAQPWYGKPEFIACMAHALGGQFFCFLATPIISWPWWSGIVVTLGWALPKEFVVDIYRPEKDSWKSSALDFSCYLAGALLACGLLWLAGR